MLLLEWQRKLSETEHFASISQSYQKEISTKRYWPDGRQLVVKIPNPNAGPNHYTTTSEVATVAYVLHSISMYQSSAKKGYGF
jgi:hypothetical protein